MTPERIVIIADNSQVSTFLECAMKWNLGFRRSLVKSEAKTRPMDNGTAIHSLLEVYYRHIALGDSKNQAMKRALELFVAKRDPKLVNDEDAQLIRERFLAYHIHYTANGDFTPLVVKGVPQVEIGFSVVLLDTPTHYFVFEGRIDLITTFPSFVDHKSQERIHNHYKLDTQFLGYGWATKLKHGMVNYFGMQKTVTPQTFRRLPLAFSTEHLEDWHQKLISIFHRMAKCVETNTYEENYGACSGAWGKHCQFTEIHEVFDPRLKESIIKNHFTVREKWQPWELEEKNAIA